ncbi:adenylate/guanylate cyclase domain-containing protein [Nocardioides sp. R-C-SC26]|uniref:adenylate/guanylate cyclase domain-containing protein n=1 Tax=Nocardioides sp. R-C-SC26 TaxID=2870414 RepID=UPI001E2B6B54|nr:adenylate/guanylate cyclase domain-containing protein [Nocardioides sp. R-C-SC26]
MTWVLGVLLAFAVAGFCAAFVIVRQQQRELERTRARIDQLESDLTAALRPRPPSSATERAVRTLVNTASKVREGGIGALLQSSIDDLQQWAATQRSEIVTMADPDGRVTLLFSDIENSTVLNEKLGDDVWVRVLAAHDSLVRTRVEQFHGQVVKTSGDGFMVVFRDAEAACRSALGIQKDLRRTLDPMLRLVTTVRVRIGIHTGVVVARDGDYFGRNVAMAARVGALAGGGEVFATEAVRVALDDDATVELDALEEVELRGLPGRHVIYRVRRR